MNFLKKLDETIHQNNSILCVGLDPDLPKLPPHILKASEPLFEFNKAIIDATADLVCAFKPNSAFYEAEGLKGIEQLKKTIDYIHNRYTGILVILDAKRGDIGNTSRMYAKAAFEYFSADAITVYPHLGLDSLLPFFEYKDKLTIVLIKTSNPDSGMFQDLPICHSELSESSGSESTGTNPYYLEMSKIISKWNFENLGILVGSTYPAELKKVREIFPDRIFLSAGIGAQKAEIEQIVKAGVDKSGKGIMFNASRSVLYASSGNDFAQKAHEEAQKIRDTINTYRT